MTMLPTLFLSHGSPMHAIEPGVAGRAWEALGRTLPRPRAVLMASAHWEAKAPTLGAAPSPPTIHDFYGFPEALYRIRYGAPGDPALAQELVERLRATGFDAHVDPARGLDHGAWVPLRYLRPDADVPVLQVSLPIDATPATALRMGEVLAPLRERGVLVVGSGSLTHNLYEFRQDVRDPEYAQAFADWVAAAVARRDVEALLDYRARAPFATRAHPTEEHFLPLLVALGASRRDEAGTPVPGGMTYGVLSMDSFAFGAPPH